MNRLLKGIVDRELAVEWCNKIQESFKNNIGLMRILKTEGRSLVFIGDNHQSQRQVG